MMEAMIRRMRRLIIGFSAYFVCIEGSYIWVSLDNFNDYNSFIWIIVHTTLGHVAIHFTLLYYVRIRDYQEFDNKNDKWSFDIAPDQPQNEKSISSKINANGLIAPLINQNNNIINKNMDNMMLNQSLSQRNQSINAPVVNVGSVPTTKQQTGALLGVKGNGNANANRDGDIINAEDWEKYEHSYRIPIDIDKNNISQ